MEKNNQIWYLIARSISGEITSEEENLLQQQLQSNPSVQQQYQVLRSLWNNSNDKETVIPQQQDFAPISRILQLATVQSALKDDDQLTVSYKRKRRRSRRTVLLFCSFALITCAVFFFLKPSVQSTQQFSNSIVAQKGTRTQTLLPDGSKVWLNAGSKISYEKKFGGHLREVTLEGEAFFDVVKDKKRPFIVHVGKMNIQVLGTAFNVKFYPGDKNIETTLLRGLIKITDASDNDKGIFIHPNQKLVIEKDKITQSIKDNYDASPDSYEAAAKQSPKQVQSEAIQLKNIPVIKQDDYVETAWMYNRLEFRGDSFVELAKKLERWYNVSVVFENEDVKQLKFNGSLENETVDQACKALQAAVPSFTYSIKNDEIFIKPSK